MLRGLKPPTHRIDHVGLFILPTDDAIDQDRLAAELAAMADARDAALTAAAGDVAAAIGVDPAELSDEGRRKVIASADLGGLQPEDHPLEAYWSGASRFDLQAEGLLMGRPVKIRDYFTKGTPTIFGIRRLPWQLYNQIAETDGAVARLAEYARHGIVSIRGPGVDVAFKDNVTDEWMQTLFDVDKSLAIHLGAAVVAFNRSLTESEKKALRMLAWRFASERDDRGRWRRRERFDCLILCRVVGSVALDPVDQAARHCARPGYDTRAWTGDNLHADWLGAPRRYDLEPGGADQPGRGDWAHPIEDVERDGCPGAWYRTAFVGSLLPTSAATTPLAAASPAPLLDRCDDRLIHDAVSFLEIQEEAAYAEHLRISEPRPDP